MSPERWQKIEEIFQDALDLPPSRRADFVAEKCADDAELKAEVEKLLLQFEDASNFIETPALSDEKAGVLSSLMEFDEDDPMIGVLLGNYQIVREIGRGGMGAVYEAIRADGEFRRKVAIKIVKRGMDTDFILRRFRNERQILATLEHPYITRLLDGGTTNDGRPYFVMDYIEGLQLYRYCDKNRLTIKQRLNLFTKICEAVEYAHQNLVIHRDLKPSNILVSSDGTPRLLDFGIAKLLNPELASDTLQPTATAMRMMTIDYASPEQINGEKVTFSTDIYSLGVILFELLTGHRPYRFTNRTPHEVARVICEELPILPSNAITRSEETLPIIHVDQEALTIRHLADLRKNSPDKLREILRGNLDNITLKALCKLPDDRYKSVNKFREDIGKHLDGQQISAPFYVQAKISQSIKTLENTKLIAVLPLKLLNFSTAENTDENYLSLGLADALINRLSNIGRLTVRPTSSILMFQDLSANPFSAGRDLKVEYVVDGNIRRVGEKIRVSVQLLQISGEETLWAENFDEKFTDVLELEDVISERVVKALLPKLTGEEQRRLEKRGTNNVDAYQAYLRGRYFANQFTDESLLKSIECYKEAILFDSNYALPHVGMADFYVWSAVFGEMSCREAYPKAKAEIERALKIDDSLGEAFAIKAFITLLYDWNWVEAERLIKHSLELNPNFGFAHECYSNFFSTQGIVDEAVNKIKRAEELDPLSPRAKLMTSWTFYVTRRFSEQVAKATEANNLQDNFAQGLIHLGYGQIHTGKIKEAVKNLRHASETWVGGAMPKFMLCFALAADNQIEEARKVLDEIISLSREKHVKPYFLGMAYTAIGENDLAFEWFEKSLEARDEWLIWFGVDAKLDNLRRDPRYLKILRQINNPIVTRQIEKTSETSKSIAVLPFQFIGEIETGEAYLSVGLADAMITRLSRIKNLTVRPTTSIIRFNNSETSLNDTAKELGVQFILNGHLKKFGNRLRITVQLLDISKNSTVWAETIDETLDDVFQLEDSVCYKVLRSLTPHLTGEELSKFEKRGTNNPKAYEAYLRGRYHWHSYTVDGISKALVCYYEAIAEDENFALPHAGVADYYNFLSIFGVMSPEESFPAAKQAAEKAISLDKNLAEAYTSLGITAYGYDWDFQKATKLLKKSLQINPNSAETRLWYGYIFGIKGEHEKAVKEFEKAEMLSPQSPSVPVSFALTLRNARQFEKGRQKLYRALELQPNNPTALQGFCWFVSFLKNFDEAEAMCQKAVKVSNRQSLPLYAYGYTLASIGKKDEARKIIDELKAHSENQYVPPIYIALIYTALGEKDSAFEWLEKCFEMRDFWAIWLPIDPRFDDLKNDKRFAEFCARIKPLSVPSDEIHQSQIDTKIFPPVSETNIIEENQTAETSKPNFFLRHKYKFATVGVFLILIAIGVANGVITFSFDDQRPRLQAANATNNRRSVAILPFQNETDNPENDFLCDGLSDTLISRLSYLPEIQVLPRSSSFSYKGKNLTPQQVGAEINVEIVLIGKLSKTDNEIRIIVELIDVKNGTKISGFDYRGKDLDLIAMQNKMASDVATYFKAGVSNDSNQIVNKSFTQNSEAFEFYLKGEYHRQKSTPEDIKKSIEFYQKALELDANYALAYQGLALTYRMSPAFGTHSPQVAYPIAKEAAMKALAIDPQLGSAHIPLASIKFVWEWDFAGAEADYKQAIQLVPNNAEAHYSYGNFLVAMGRYDEALNELRIAQQFDPISLTISSNIAWALYVAGRYNEAEIQAKQVLARDPNFARGYLVLGEIYQEQGKFEQSIANFQKSKQISNDTIGEMALGHVYATAGRKVEALKIAQDLEEKVLEKEVSPFLPAVVYAGLNDKDKAFYWLERAFQERSNWLTLAKAGHRLKPLHGDPRFNDLLKRIGFNQ